MKIAFNPSTVAALIAPPNNKDITFDLRGHNIFARGVKFCGTDTNTWRDIKINNVSIDSNTLDLRDGDNTTLTNINGVVTINSTWRPVVDNLTSDSTTSSLSANLGRILKALIDGKSDSGHNHDDRYLKLTGGTISGRLLVNSNSNSYTTPSIAINYYDSYTVNDYSITQIKMGNPKYDMYLGLSPTVKGYYGKIGYFMHANTDCEFLWGTSEWTKRMALECSSGNLWVSGSITASSFIGNASTATNAQNIRIDQYASAGEYPIIWADSASSNANSNTISRLYKTWKYLYWTPNKKTLTLAGNGTKCAIGSAFDTNDRPGLHITGNYPELIMMSLNVSNTSHGSTIVLGAYTSNSDSETNYRAFAIGMNGPTTNEAFLDFGYGVNLANPHANGIANYGGGSFNNPYIMRLTASKRVFIQGIGEDLKPALLVNTYRNGGWVYTASFLAPNLTSNNNNAIFIGKAHSACNAFGLTHMHIGDGSVNNYAALEVWGVGNVLRWYYDRHSSFLHRADFSSLGSDASYMNSALLIREHGYNGAQADTWANAPRMSWHWSGRVQTQIGLASNNELYLSKNNFGNAYKLVYETGTWGINISGNATTSTKSEYSRSLLGRSTSGNDYDTNSANLVFAEWNTMSDNRWYLKATGYECRVAYANNAGDASRVYGYVGDTGSHELVRCDMNNDQFRIIAGSSGNNNGWAEIATADDGNEPIYVRQYTGVFSSVRRTLTLLDGSGNTTFPGSLSIGGQIIREGHSALWIYGRDVALLRETTAPGYHTLWSLKTTNGSWDFGEYNTSGMYNVPILSYITDSNYNSGNNVVTYQIKFPLASGTVALTSYGGDSSHPIFLGYLDLDHGNNGTVSSSFYCLGYSVPFTYTRGGNYCRISIPDTTHQVFYIKAAIASVNYSGGGMDTWTGVLRGEGAWWLHCYASGLNEVRVKGFCLRNGNNDSWWGGNPLYSSINGANRITVCIFGYVTFR